MFENIIGHGKLLNRLKKEVEENLLPSTLLFYGEPYSGKLTTALELARVLTCLEGKGEWNCQCQSCSLQRVLLHPDTMLLGSRSFTEEISASAEVLRRNDKPFARYLLIRSVRKLTRRFDPLLWDGQESKLKKIFPVLEALEGELEKFYPGKELPEEKIREKEIKNLIAKAEEIASFLGSENIPINQIRRVSYWTHSTSPGRNRVVILEGAEKMLEGSRNALLKTLEEPAPGCYFILIATNKGAVIPTILSRSRSYYFLERSVKETQEVLSKIFREDPGDYHGLKEYFLAWNTAPVHQLRGVVKNYLSSALGRTQTGQIPEEVLPENVDKKYASLFLLELVELLQDLNTPSSGEREELPLSLLENWYAKIRETQTRIDLYNLNPSLGLENLFYTLRDGA